MKWLLKLKKPDENIERWMEILEAIPDRVHQEEENYYLCFPELEHEKEPQAAYDHATAYLDKLNRALKFIAKESDQFKTAGFYRVEADGSKHDHGFGEPAIAQARVPSALLESGNREDSIQKRQRFVELAMNDEMVTELLKLKDLQLTTLNMYNILEGIVRYDLGDGSWNDGFSKAEKLGPAPSKSEMKALKRSLQLRKTVGTQARHYFSSIDPPKKELTLHQMRRVLRNLIRAWLSYKESNFMWEQ